jgi:hypothetical protein
MKIPRPLVVFSFALLLGTIPATAARAQVRTEVGASLINATFIFSGGDNATLVGVPSGAFGLITPGAYASFLIGPRTSIDPLVGFVSISGSGESDYVLNIAAQFSFYLKSTMAHSPYVFASAGVLKASGEGYTPKSFGAGAGYRFLVGNRLVVRIDGRYTLYTSNFGDDMNSVSLTLSIGGVFGK